jgi:hypothetical protein
MANSSKKPNTKKAGGVAQGVDSDFKHQCCKKKSPKVTMSFCVLQLLLQYGEKRRMSSCLSKPGCYALNYSSVWQSLEVHWGVPDNLAAKEGWRIPKLLFSAWGLIWGKQ